MLQRLLKAITPSKGRSLAKSYSRLGWAGLWLQIVIGAIPILVMGYFLVFSRAVTITRSGLPFVEYLTFVNLLFLLFTAFWSYRYTRLAKRMLDPERRPSESQVISVVWTGVVVSTVGMLFSMIVMLIEAANLLYFFLKTPQGGIPVVQTTSGSAVYWVSAVDMVSLMALIVMLFAELIVLVFSLWLLFRTTLGSPEMAEDVAGSAVKETA